MQNVLARTKHYFLEANLQSTLQNLSSHKQLNQFHFIMLVEDMAWRGHGSLLFNAKFSFFKNFLNFFRWFYCFSPVEGNANDFPLHTRMKTRSCWRLKYLHTEPPLGRQRNLPLKKVKNISNCHVTLRWSPGQRVMWLSGREPITQN